MARRHTTRISDLEEAIVGIHRRIDQLEQIVRANAATALGWAKIQQSHGHQIAELKNTKPATEKAPRPTAPTKGKTDKRGRKWTEDEIALLLILKDQGARVNHIAAVLGRSGRGVQQMLDNIRRGKVTR